MNITYGKLTQYGSLQILNRVPNVSNATPETFKEYADENGYLEVVYTSSPGRYYEQKFEIVEDKIVQNWTPQNVDTVKNQMMEEVQMSLNNQLTLRTNVPCSLGFNVVYDVDAQINLLGLMSTGQGTEAFIDADNNIHALTFQELQAVAAAIMGHKQKLYVKATEIRAQIQKAETVEELEQISPWFNVFYDTTSDNETESSEEEEVTETGEEVIDEPVEESIIEEQVAEDEITEGEIEDTPISEEEISEEPIVEEQVTEDEIIEEMEEVTDEPVEESIIEEQVVENEITEEEIEDAPVTEEEISEEPIEEVTKQEADEEVEEEVEEADNTSEEEIADEIVEEETTEEDNEVSEEESQVEVSAEVE